MAARSYVFACLVAVAACTPDTLHDVAPPPKSDAGEALGADAGDFEMDAGTIVSDDAGTIDAGSIDAGEQGTPDAGTHDAGPRPSTMPPPPPTYSNGTCPTLVSGPTGASANNTNFMSGPDARSFKVIVPMNYDPAVPTPVVFAWHWLNASSNSFVRDGELESATEEMGFIAVVPDKKLKPNGDKAYLFDWPFVEVNDAPGELMFFDDMLACVTEQFNVDAYGVYGIGVSAGALWLTYMSSQPQIDHFAAVESLSGGLGEAVGAWRMEFTPRAHKFPALVLWGGSRDWLGLDFNAASQRYRDALTSDSHFVVSCIHDSGHSMPPIQPPVPGGTRFRSLWQFMLDHPYGLPPGESPYLMGGIPSVFPEWCSIASP